MGVRTVFYVFRNTAAREAQLLDAGGGSHLFYGMKDLDPGRWRGVCNLPQPGYRRVPHFLNVVLNGVLKRTGHLETDFYGLFCHWRGLKEADVCFGTNDAVGLALLWLRRWGLLRCPVVYTSIGMPDRLGEMPERERRKCLRLLRHASLVLCYGWREAEVLRDALGNGAGVPPVRFLPFFVNCEVFRPSPCDQTVDVVSIGSDRMRDVGLFLEFFRRHPEFRGVLIHGAGSRPEGVPPNVRVYCELSIEEVKTWILRSRVVALPVKQNTYSGATTTLLQALAMGAAVVVAETGAIEDGYGLADGRELCLYPPDRPDRFEEALLRMLGDRAFCERLSATGAVRVAETLNHRIFIEKLQTIFEEVCDVET